MRDNIAKKEGWLTKKVSSLFVAKSDELTIFCFFFPLGNGCCCDCCMLLCDPCMPLCVKRCCCCPPTSDDSYPKIFYGSVSQEDQESTDHGSPGHGSPGELQSVVPVAKIFKFPQKFQELSPHPQLDDNNEGFIRPVITEQPSTCRGISMTLQNDGFSFDPGDLDSEDNEEEDDRVDSVACKRKVSFATDYSNVYQKSPEESNEEDSDDMLVYSGVRASSIPSHVNVGSIERTPEHTLLRKCDVPRPRRCSSLQTNFAAEISLKLKQEMMMPQSPGSPSIHFALYYDKQNSCLTVHISKAVHLYTSSPVDSSNPYVMTYLLPCKNTMQQSPSIKGTHDPKFDYVFKFFGIDPEAVEQQVLVIKVYINNVNHFIGGIIHELKNSDLFGNSIIREISEFDEHSSLKVSCIVLIVLLHALFGILTCVNMRPVK